MSDEKPNVISETELWNRFRYGDQAAYTALIKKYASTLLNYGCRIHDNRDFVKDCIQEVFIELWHRQSAIKETSSIKWYLFKAVRLRIIRELPKWDKNERLEDDYEFAVEFNVETQMIKDLDIQELSLKVQKTLSSLPPRQREIIYLRFFENLDFEEISVIMQINRQSVHNLLQKAYKSFRGEWSGHLPLLLMTVFKF